MEIPLLFSISWKDGIDYSLPTTIFTLHSNKKSQHSITSLGETSFYLASSHLHLTLCHSNCLFLLDLNKKEGTGIPCRNYKSVSNHVLSGFQYKTRVFYWEFETLFSSPLFSIILKVKLILVMQFEENSCIQITLHGLY